MRKHTQIRIASAAMATLLAATQIAMPFPAIAADEDYVYCAAALSWAEYWEQEGVFLSDDANGDWTAESADSDTRDLTWVHMIRLLVQPATMVYTVAAISAW